MKISRIALAFGISLNLVLSLSATSAATTVEFNILLPDDGGGDVETVDITGFAPNDPVALFNVLVPPGGGKLGSLTIYTSYISDSEFGRSAVDYDYDLKINGIMQEWSEFSGDGYRYLFDVPLMGGNNEFHFTLKALSPNQMFAPSSATAQFFFLGKDLPVPIPLPASGVLMIGAILGLIRLRQRVL